MRHQQGVGLIEVLVSLLILAVAVLGYVALQYRAVEATAESGSRIQAINLARDLAERMRVNRGAENVYAQELGTASKQFTSLANCFTENCTSAKLADFDVAQITIKVRAAGMTMNYLPCQGNNDGRECIYVAWGETAPTNGDAGSAGNCTRGTAYDPSSTCLIMEVY